MADDDAGATTATTEDATTTTTTDATPDDKPLGEAGEKALEAFKQRARDAEKRAKEAEARAKEFEDKDKSELERAQSRVSELEQSSSGHETEKQELLVEVAILKSATKAGITEPDVAAKLLDRSKIDFDESGQPKNMPKLLEELGKEHPFLLDQARRPTSMDGGVRQSAPTGDDMDARIRQAAGL